MSKAVIGVDPGAITGIAVVYPEAQMVIAISSPKWPQACAELRRMIRLYHPRLVKMEFPAAGTWTKRPTANACFKARAVGKLEQKCQDLFRVATEEAATYGGKVTKVRPSRKLTKKNMTHEAWCRVFRWKGPAPNEHVRDAACIAL